MPLLPPACTSAADLIGCPFSMGFCGCKRIQGRPDDRRLCVWRRVYFGGQILCLVTLQFSVSSPVAAMDDEVFEMFGGECTRLLLFAHDFELASHLAAELPCARVVPAVAMRCAGWSFMLSDMANTAISCVTPFALKNLAMTVFRSGSLAVCSPRPCRDSSAWCVPRISRTRARRKLRRYSTATWRASSSMMLP